MNLLCEGGFCEKISTSFRHGTTYKFREKISLDMLLQNFVKMAVDDPEYIYKTNDLGLSDFHKEMLKFLYESSKSYRFREMIKRNFNKTLKMFNSDAQLYNTYKKLVNVVEPMPR